MLQCTLTHIRAKLRKVVCPIDEVCNCVPLGASVFDLGCGTGAMLLELIRTRGVQTVGGCEVSRSLLHAACDSVAGELGAQGQFLEAATAPECVGNYDCVTLIDVLHHIPRAQHWDYIGQIAANMRSGATLVFKDIDASSCLVWFNRLHDAVFAGNGFQEASFDVALKHITDSGLSVESTKKIRRLVYPHYFIIARKK